MRFIKYSSVMGDRTGSRKVIIPASLVEILGLNPKDELMWSYAEKDEKVPQGSLVLRKVLSGKREAK